MNEKIKLLLVDDSNMNIAIMQQMLAKYDYDITAVTNGYAAIDVLSAGYFDLVLLDYLMPEINGSATLKMIRDNETTSANAPAIVVMSADDSGYDPDRYLEEGFTEFLKKPVKLSELRDIILRHTSVGRTLDKATGLEYCGGDERILREVMKAFIETDFIGKLVNDFEKQDFKNYQIDVHGLKSGAKSIGAMHLSEHAKQLEYALKFDNDSDYIISHHSDLIKETFDIYDQINNY